jgi:hypothetical protein
MNNDDSNKPVVLFAIVPERGRVREVSTTSPLVNHFLDLMKMSRAYNTWVSYTQDLKVFFKTILKPPEAITRTDCREFMKRQDEAGCSGATINRHLAAVSSLFNELCLLEPDSFSRNPVHPRQRAAGWPAIRRWQAPALPAQPGARADSRLREVGDAVKGTGTGFAHGFSP